MNDSQRMEILRQIHDRAPNTRINSALWQIKRAERKEELQRPVNRQRGVVAMIRKLTGKA